MAIKRFLCALTVLCCSCAHATPEQFDELVHQIESGQRYFFSLIDFQTTLQELETTLPANDPVRRNIFDRMRCMLGFFDQPQEGIEYSDTQLAAAKARGDSAALADYYVCRYYLFSQLGQAQQAEQNAQSAYQAASDSENPLSIAISLNLLGSIASYQGNYADAMQHYVTAYQLQRGLGYKPYISDLVLSIAATYRRMGLYQDALAYIEQAEQEFTSPDEQFRHALIMHEKAYSYAELGQYQQALQLFEQSMAVYQQLKEPMWRTFTKVNLVWINNLLKRYDIAMTLAKEAQSELDTLQTYDMSSVATYRGLLAMYHGETLLALQKTSEALAQFTRAETELSNDDNPRYMLMLYKAKAAGLAAAGRHGEAYTLLSQYLERTAVQQQKAREQQSNLLRVQFDSVRQQERNNQLKAEKQLIEQHVTALETAQRWQYAALGLIVLMLVILLAFALSLKKRNQRLHRLAMTDELTNVANRRRIMMQAEQERVKAIDTKAELSFLILDLDHFKQVNDCFGHDAGDIVLQQMCITVCAMLREQDRFGRTGGEEFLIVLPDANAQQAEIIAERLRQAIAAIAFTGYDNLAVTCSIGISQYQAPEALNSSLSRADKALYRAKAEGRNKVVCAQ
ncbi:MAG TPA: tetratricopeptide repeat-containing diguanylate cyclase [Rheinheimera sp.]|uniref:tetratricopeptide repeat-containing diguanylate cyclase n=1 Tax=Rheinheimera sp. TaxID=1869214 RepID=UPI002F93C637